MKKSCDRCFWREQCKSAVDECEYFYPASLDDMSDYELDSDISFVGNNWMPGFIIFETQPSDSDTEE